MVFNKSKSIFMSEAKMPWRMKIFMVQNHDIAKRCGKC